MSGFRLFSKLNTFYGLTGQLLALGYLKFYEAGTTTPADVFGEQDLSTNNGSTIALDSSGRPDVDIWGDIADSYLVEVYAADDTLQGSADDIGVPGGSGTAFPALVDGEFLTSDGVVLLFDSIRQVPDPTGQDTKILGVVGSTLTWIPKPADGAAGTSDTSNTSTTFKVGSFLGQTGSDSAPASSNKSTTKSVVFAKTYDATPVHISITPTSGGVTPNGVFPKWAVTAKSTTGFTVAFNTTTGGSSADSYSGSNITSAVGFDWIAFGVRVAA